MVCFVKRGCIAFVAIVLLVQTSGCRSWDEGAVDVDFSSSLRTLTNVYDLALAPLGKAGMISSYDRSGGNADGSTFIPTGLDRRITVADLKGPGCVRRIWATGGPDKKWQFYIDGESEPRINLKREEIFGGTYPFLEPLSRIFCGARHCYVPIPFAKSLRIVFEYDEVKPGMTPYCQINYEIFPKGTRVKSFPRRYAFDEKERMLVDEVRGHWREFENPIGGKGGALPVATQVLLEPGATASLLEHSGAAVLREFRITLDAPAGTTALARSQLLRNVVLRASWDHAAEPSVDVPLGDFFCSALRWRRFNSLLLGNGGGNTLICRFPMPFREAARVELRNDGRVPLAVRFAYALDEAPLTLDNMRYFHACWTQSTRTGVPFHLMDTRGRGHLVGCYVLSHGMDGSWNNLEGDEMIRVDGEMVPSIHGTGLEDYFNGGWYYYGLFDLPFAGLLEKAAMQTAQYRFHMPDRVGFDESLSFDFEFGDANRSRGYMSAATYWYQDQPVSAGTVMPTTAQRFPQPNAIAHAATMAELFELERIGLELEALERCAAFAEQYAQSPYVEALELRQIAYSEQVNGYEKVEEEYEAFAKTVKDPLVRAQAANLMWIHESTSNALAFANMNGAYELYLDGERILAGDNPLKVDVARVVLSPGTHELAAKVVATRNRPWCRLTLRTSTSNIVTDAGWESSSHKPHDWPQETGGVQWHGVKLHVVPPFMGFWQFEPNGYAGMQSGRCFIQPEAPWKTGRSAFFRTKFDVLEEGVVRRRQALKASDDPDDETMKVRRTSGVDIE